MKPRVFTGIEKPVRIIWITLSLVAILLFFGIQTGRTEFRFYEYGLYVVGAAAVLWAIVLFGLVRTRIEVDADGIYGPFYPWYEGFRIDPEEKPMLKSIPFATIEAIHFIKVAGLKRPEEYAIRMVIRGKYDVCLPLDGYRQDKAEAIHDSIVAFFEEHNAGKSRSQAKTEKK